MRDSISATEGSPVPAFSSSTETSISDIVMPSRKCLSACRRAISSSRSFSEYCFSPFFRAMRVEDHTGSRLSIFRRIIGQGPTSPRSALRRNPAKRLHVPVPTDQSLNKSLNLGARPPTFGVRAP